MIGSNVFPNAVARLAFKSVCLIWIIAEVGVRYLAARHKTKTVKRDDRGSLWIIFLGYLASVGGALGIRRAGIGLLPAWMEWPGLVFMLMGIALRTWAIYVLGGFFAVHAELQAGHRVVSEGPFRYIRHPAYTGIIITFAGLGLAFGSWAAALVMSAIFWAALSYRVRVEEAFLLSAIGSEYQEYMECTGRFVPGLCRCAGKNAPG